MKRWTVVIALLAALFASVTPVLAQNTSPVSGLSGVFLGGSRGDAAVFFATSATSAATITITPPAGQFVYVTYQELSNTVSGTAVTAAAQTSVTTTGLGSGTTPVWTIPSGTTAGSLTSHMTNSSLVKSNTAGAAVTYVLPTFATNQTIRVGVWYYTAP